MKLCDSLGARYPSSIMKVMTLMLIMINCANLCLCILGSWHSVLLELPWENGGSLGGTGWSMSEFC